MDNLMQDMFRDVVERGVDRTQALKALRALSQYYGGQQLYIPQKKTALAEEIIGIMSDAIGGADAEKMYAIIAQLYGGVQWYVPIEKNAFRDFIALEILSEYDGSRGSMRELCQKYGISFTQVYRLFYEARQKKLQQELDFPEE